MSGEGEQELKADVASDPELKESAPTEEKAAETTGALEESTEATDASELTESTDATSSVAQPKLSSLMATLKEQGLSQDVVEANDGLGKRKGAHHGYGSMMGDTDEQHRFPWRGCSLREKIWGNDYEAGKHGLAPDQDGRQLIRDQREEKLKKAEELYKTARQAFDKAQGKLAKGKIAAREVQKLMRATEEAKKQLDQLKIKEPTVDKGCGAACDQGLLYYLRAVKKANPFFKSEIEWIAREHGAGVMQYFLMYRWMITLNFGIFILWFCFIGIPWLMHPPHFIDSTPSNVTFWDRDDITAWMLLGRGIAASESFMYYSGYQPYPDQGNYHLGAFWICCSFATILITLLTILWKLVKTVMERKHDLAVQEALQGRPGQNCHRELAEKVLTGHDHSITDSGNIMLERQSTYMGLQTILDDQFAQVGTMIMFDLPELAVEGGADEKRVAKVLEMAEDLAKPASASPGNVVKEDALVPAAKGAVFVTDEGLRSYKAWETIDEDLQAATERLTAAEDGLKKAQEAVVKGVLSVEDGTTSAEGEALQPLTKEELDLQLQAAQKELQIAKDHLEAKTEFKNVGAPDLGVWHFDNNPNGVLMMAEPFRIAVAVSETTNKVLRVADIESPGIQKLDEGSLDALIMESMEAKVSDADAALSASEREAKFTKDIGALNMADKRIKCIEWILDKPKEVFQGDPYLMESRYARHDDLRTNVVKDTHIGQYPVTASTKAWLEKKQTRKPMQFRFVFSFPHEATVIGAEDDDDDCCFHLTTYTSAKRVMSLVVTFILMMATVTAYVATLTHQDYIIHHLLAWTGSFASSGPNILLTCVKVVVPQIVAALVALEAWDDAEKAMTEITWRVYVIKLVALCAYIAELDTWEKQDPMGCDSSGEYVAADCCAAHYVGFTYLNLVIVNFVFNIACNLGVYGAFYWMSGARTEYNAKTVALYYVELFYTQAIIWVGTQYSPVMPFYYVVTASVDLLVMVWIIKKLCKPAKAFDGESAKDITEMVLAVTFAVSVIFIAMFFDGDPAKGMVCGLANNATCTSNDQYIPCGPISRTHHRRYEAFTQYINGDIYSKLSTGGTLQHIVEMISQPAVIWLFCIIVCACLCYSNIIIDKLRQETIGCYEELAELEEDKSLLAKKGRKAYLAQYDI
jgi:hypothetical protein